MNQIKIIKRLGLGLFLLGACSLNIDGIFKVKTQLEFIQKTFWGTKKIPVAPGTYNATIALDDGNNTVDLFINTGSSNKTKITFKAPIESIPLDGSWVEVPANQTGQPYDVRLAAKKTVDKEDELRRGYEHCTYQYCYRECNGDGPNRQCRDVCETRHGERFVEYYLVHTYWNAKFKLGRPNNFNLADFNGDRHDTSRDYVYIGSCH